MRFQCVQNTYICIWVNFWRKMFPFFAGADSFRGMYVLRSLKLNRMYQLTSIDSDTFKASGENVQLKSLELSNNEKLQPLPWGIFSANVALTEVTFTNNTAWSSLFPSQVPVKSVQKLQISGIPFYCNCSLTWLWELYQQNSSVLVDQALCQSVSNSALRNVPIQVCILFI